MLTQNNQVSCEHVNVKDIGARWMLDNRSFQCLLSCLSHGNYFSLAESNLHCRSSSSIGLHLDFTHIFDIGSNAMFHAVFANHRFFQQPAKSAWSGEKPFYVRCHPGCYRSTCQDSAAKPVAAYIGHQSCTAKAHQWLVCFCCTYSFAKCELKRTSLPQKILRTFTY